MDNVQQQPDLEARSPWSAHAGVENVRLRPPMRAIDGRIQVAGSKSLTNRALILAALAEGTSRIEGILRSDDAYWCIDCLKKLGIRITVDGDCAVVEGCGGIWPNSAAELYVGAAGTAARFLPGALAVGTGSWTMSGSRRLQDRPIAPLLDALTRLGAQFTYTGAVPSLPFTLEASGLGGGEVMMPGDASSQFISGMLLAAPYAQEAITLRIEGEVVQRDYVEMTLMLMREFGITPQVSADEQSITVPVGQYQARTITLEPDISTCCYFWALAALTAGRVRIEGIDASRTTQPDIEMLGLLERMGCTIIRGQDYVEVQGAAQLRGGFALSMKKWSDQALTVAVLAIFADGSITMTDAAHIRHHECDRIAAICTELRRMGIRADEHPDGLTVYPGEPVPALLESYDDHRMAMALALVGSRIDGIRIKDPGCVSKTCPDYFERMAGLGLQIEYATGGTTDGR